MVETIGDGTNIGSEAIWEMMHVYSNGGLVKICSYVMYGRELRALLKEMKP